MACRSDTAVKARTSAMIAARGLALYRSINALAQSVIGLYKTECVRREGPIRSVEDLEIPTASWVHP